MQRTSNQCTESGRNTWRFCNTAVSRIVGVRNLSLSALLARLKAFQLPWSAGLYSIGLSLWRRISKTTILSLWLSGYFVGTSIFIGTTVSLVAILYCCGWETSEMQRLPQKENVQEDSLHLELLRTSNDCVRLLSEVLRLREYVDNKGRHLTDTILRKWILSLKCFEIKIVLVINSHKKIVHFSFYCNFKIVRFFCRTLYLLHGAESFLRS